MHRQACLYNQIAVTPNQVSCYPSFRVIRLFNKHEILGSKNGRHDPNIIRVKLGFRYVFPKTVPRQPERGRLRLAQSTW